MMKITIWNEFYHEREDEEVKKIYPNGLHTVLADFLRTDDVFVRTATLDMEDHGLTQEVLNDTDVLIWWGHKMHDALRDDIVQKVYEKVQTGMGLIVLHSGHGSKIFAKLMGTTCSLSWRDGARERLWCCNPAHPIAQGVPDQILLPKEEMYGEWFDIPKPDDVIFMGWFDGGEVFRSGCTFTRGYGKIFYFQPGHEAYPIYYDKDVQKIITNAVKWAKAETKVDKIDCIHLKASE